ncbi:hypothetical protein [Emergencia sp. 1XD21-10]|uniref:hypothetical protein n=1 Tax=Emergencia sp. 1XD21-10 TaxID=2304569 RepID=UPI00137B50CB|nr:hypothetical protein [Emergencia sp. 1XD21-10]NCE98426.1 hypothetical protein [Emergencia sp. 1XD21-10]
MNRVDFIKGSTHLLDRTAYEAFRNIEREEKRMSRAGEIWECEFSNGTIREVIILSDQGSICTVVILQDEDNGYCDIHVNCKGRMHANSAKLQYSYDKYLTNFIRKLTDEEYAEIMALVAESLGISQQVIEKEVIKEVEVVKEIPCGDNIERERIKAQLEVYKGMNERLLKGLFRNE